MIKKKENISKGGDAGSIMIFAKKIVGNGEILADGGNGSSGGKGGKIIIETDEDNFTGKISAKGGNSLSGVRWWEQSWIQVIMFVSAVAGIILAIYQYAN